MASYSRITSRIYVKISCRLLNSGDQTSINHNQCSCKSQTDAQENVDKSDVQNQSVRTHGEESTSASDVPEKRRVFRYAAGGNATKVFCTLFVLFYCSPITQKPAKSFYIYLHYNFSRVIACRVAACRVSVNASKDVLCTLQSESVTRAQEIITVAQTQEIVNDLPDY